MRIRTRVKKRRRKPNRRAQPKYDELSRSTRTICGRSSRSFGGASIEAIRLECGVGFRQLRTCRRTRPGQQCAMCGRLRVGKSFLHVRRLGSVLPCVRPFSAVHMTAGHNALRGSGPGQKPAFEDAMAQVGCPDRRIDRLCITCCSPSQPFTSRRLSGAISFTAQALRVACSARLWPSWPRPSAQSC